MALTLKQQARFTFFSIWVIFGSILSLFFFILALSLGSGSVLILSVCCFLLGLGLSAGAYWNYRKNKNVKTI